MIIFLTIRRGTEAAKKTSGVKKGWSCPYVQFFDTVQTQDHAQGNASSFGNANAGLLTHVGKTWGALRMGAADRASSSAADLGATFLMAS